MMPNMGLSPIVGGGDGEYNDVGLVDISNVFMMQDDNFFGAE